MLASLGVILATAAAWGLGAFWYGALAEPWMQASGVPRDDSGKPKGGQNPLMYVASFVMILAVAGMMRHIFASGGIDGIVKGLVSGGGIGLFVISPWIALNNMYGMRPVKLTLIDGGYATSGCAAMGLVLGIF